ncbi:hypothetical protein SANTM175S_04505 [Streptomyces antimycoticus]
MMGHAGMAATAVRYLRAVGSPTAAVRPVEPLPPPELRWCATMSGHPVDRRRNSASYWAISRAGSP